MEHVTSATSQHQSPINRLHLAYTRSYIRYYKLGHTLHHSSSIGTIANRCFIVFYFVCILAFYQLNTFISSTFGDPDARLDEPQPYSSHSAGEPGVATGLALPATSSSTQPINNTSLVSSSLSLVEYAQLQGTLNCQRNYQTWLIHGTTIPADAPWVSPGQTLPLIQLITLSSGSYTQQSTSHAIACVQAFTRPSSNSPRALTH